MDDIGAAGNAVRGKSRIWVPLAVVAVLLALIGAETAFERSQPDAVQLVPDTVIEFGADRDASVQVGDGWAVDNALSDLNSRLVLVHGDVMVELTSVTYPDGTTPDEMWTGLDRLLDIERHQGIQVRLSEAAEYRNAAGLTGVQGDIQIGDRAGQAFVLPDGEGVRAVQVQVLAPAQSEEDSRAAATALVDSIAFEEES
ncbi:hypothetical protein [Glycomyces niveus]|uniref:DUF1795 domain-containing protein n=1 Tax=Glycomyces niveus TaxID=2820287 RepID=A0ABS3U1V0_9ACTN|nr:hypothetical protein [Glycomyces sp. NEAU-S30]MBO3732710.1 hypothetical protein [Glycomyces sp. NEAU-S30]